MYSQLELDAVNKIKTIVGNSANVITMPETEAELQVYNNVNVTPCIMVFFSESKTAEQYALGATRMDDKLTLTAAVRTMSKSQRDKLVRDVLNALNNYRPLNYHTPFRYSGVNYAARPEESQFIEYHCNFSIERPFIDIQPYEIT